MKQNVPPKPIKRDINVWECAEIKWLHMQPSHLRITEHGLGYRIVLELSQPFIGKHHHVFCDNFLTSTCPWFIERWDICVKQFTTIPEVSEWIVNTKSQCESLPERRVKILPAWKHCCFSPKRHKVSLLSSHTIQSSWQRNCEQKPAWWIYHSSFHCPCRHFVQQEHGRSRPEWSAKTVLRCGPQVAQVVALPAVVLVDISIVNAQILETEADNIPPHLKCSSKLS